MSILMESRHIALSISMLGSLALFSTGCVGGAALRAKAQSVGEKLDAIEKPAYKCAPEDLAVAKAHLAFARLELDQGAYFRAKEHLEISVAATQRAEQVAPRAECQENTDRDGDGIFDRVDLCPDAQEDFDGFEDQDGCPEDQDTDGDGIPDSRDKCPNDPEDFDGFEDVDGCPDLDRDGDGISDGVDQCPDNPEDKDGFEDEDGCPDLDHDKDRIPVPTDQCPNDPEDYDGDADEDGCPDLYKAIIVKDDRIELKQTIFFATNKDVILSKSFPMLNEVGMALRDNAALRVRIEGHTDSQGKDAYNKKLSQRRADSVRRYLIGQGVEGDRMVAEGFGEERPIEDNRTTEGRAANRRVEFIILK